MANQTHLEVLSKGVETWNAWRLINKQLKPDLSHADLRFKDFRACNFTNTNLANTNLSNSNLTLADFSNSKLLAATLTHCILNYTKFNYTNLTSVDFSFSEFKGGWLNYSNCNHALFYFTSFNKVEIKYTSFENARFGQTNFIDGTLVNALGLEQSQHRTPSYVELEVLQKSGILPKEFSKGIGLADWEIEELKLFDPNLRLEDFDKTHNAIHELIKKPVQNSMPFITHAVADEEFIRRLQSHFDKKGIRHYLNPQDTEDYLDAETAKNLYAAFENKCLILILSTHSFARPWFLKQLLTNLSEEDQLFIINLTKAGFLESLPQDLKQQLDKHTIVSFSNWPDEDELQRSYQQLEVELDLFRVTSD